MSKRYSEKDKLRLVSGWAESRESRAAYARRHGVSVGSLARWEADLGSGRADDSAMRFVEVDLPAQTVGRQDPDGAGVMVAELLLPGGARVRFFSREGAC
jgi:transposase-like protein